MRQVPALACRVRVDGSGVWVECGYGENGGTYFQSSLALPTGEGADLGGFAQRITDAANLLANRLDAERAERLARARIVVGGG